MEAVLDVYVVINAECAFGAAARAAIFAGVQPSRLTLRGLPLSGGVAPGYSQYSLPGWIVLLAPGLCARCAFSPFATPAAIFAGVQPSRLILRELPLSGGVAPGYSQYSLPGYNPPSVSSSL